jgi:hypothetical protein
MTGHGTPSTTARESVNNDGLVILSWLKIQSSPFVKALGPSRLTVMRWTCCFCNPEFSLKQVAALLVG